MVQFAANHRRAELAAELRRARITAGLSQQQLAAALGIGQGAVSRTEAGEIVAKLPRVRAWLQAVGTLASRIETLVRLAEETQLSTTSWRSGDHQGPLQDLRTAQQHTRQVEASARLLRSFQPMTVPGLLQTSAYMRRLFTSSDDLPPAELAAGILARQERQTALYDEQHRFEFVIAEAALRWRFGPVPEHLEQLERVRSATTRPNVLVAVIPESRIVPLWHAHGFTVFDERDDDSTLVHVETLTSAVDLTAPEDVRAYQDLFDRLRETAATGTDLAALLDRVAEHVATASTAPPEPAEATHDHQRDHTGTRGNAP